MDSVPCSLVVAVLIPRDSGSSLTVTKSAHHSCYAEMEVCLDHLAFQQDMDLDYPSLS